MLHRRRSFFRPALRAVRLAEAFALVLLAATLLAPTPTFAQAQDTDDAPPDSVWRVNLVAQTDSRAEMTPCHCPGIGSSLALRAGVFKRMRVMHEAFLMLDGGDAVPTDSVFHYQELANLVVDSMEKIAYDAAVPGETELALGPEAVAAAAERLPLVCANLSLGDGKPLGIPAVRYLEAGGHTVAVTGYVDPLLYYTLPGVFDAGSPPFLVQDPRESLTPVLEEAGKRADLVVLLAHATPGHVEELLPRLSGVSAVVIGHPVEERTRFRTLDGVPVLEPGPRSREIAQVRLDVRAGGAATDVFHRVWDLRQEGPEDPIVEALVQKYKDTYGEP